MNALGICLLFLLVSLSQGLCPQPAELKDTDGNKICARLFEDSSVYYDDCCSGSYIDVAPGTDVPYIPIWWINRISSLVVGSRCELTVWSIMPKQGTTRKFSSGVQPRLAEVKKGLFGDWDDSISSYYCKCS